MWLRLAADYKRLPLSATHNALLAFTPNPKWNLPIYWFDALLMPPLPSFLIVLHSIRSIYSNRIVWLCLQCYKEDHLAIRATTPFTTRLTNFLFQWAHHHLIIHPERLLSPPFPGYPELSWDYIINRPNVRIATGLDHEGGYSKHHYCKLSPKMFRNMGQAKH